MNDVITISMVIFMGDTYNDTIYRLNQFGQFLHGL